MAKKPIVDKSTKLKISAAEYKKLNADEQANFKPAGSSFEFTSKVVRVVNPERAGGDKAVFQYGEKMKGPDYIGHVTIHNLTQSKHGKFHRHGATKHFKKSDRDYIAEARKFCKSKGYELDP
ncbi:MAG: hypothetical protein AB3N23_19660 [Paracoccaceae bacterium]